MNRLSPWLCAAASGLAIFCSMGLGGTVAPGPGLLWLVALVAPVPVLWFAFRAEKSWAAGLAAFAASVLGAANLLPVYGRLLPLPVLALALVAPALGFALSALAGRYVMRRITPISGVFAFAFLWTGADYLLSLGANGAASSPAYAQLSLPAMVQIASVAGLWGITFVVAVCSAAAAMAIVTRQRLFVALAVGVIALNLAYGLWRIETAPAAPLVKVAAAADDDLIPLRFKDDPKSAETVIDAYAAAAQTLTGADLIVFPERVAVLKPEWSAIHDRLRNTARHTGALVIGFDDRNLPRSNAAYFYFGNGAAPISYAKRHLVPGLESVFTPGGKSFMTSDFTGVAVCKDMDFPDSLRAEAILQPNLYAVPAWDFGGDGPWHARLAILRGVENGFAVVRAANDGLLSVSDAYGRVIAAKSTATGGMVTLSAKVARGPGRTLYASVGDELPQIALAMALLLIGVAVAGPKRRV